MPPTMNSQIFFMLSITVQVRALAMVSTTSLSVIPLFLVESRNVNTPNIKTKYPMYHKNCIIYSSERVVPPD